MPKALERKLKREAKKRGLGKKTDKCVCVWDVAQDRVDAEEKEE
jgi:hypothetical protein